MKYLELVLITILIYLVAALSSNAQGPKGNSFGFGIILGEPTGLTAKIWTANDEAVALSLGNSYFGKLRLSGDYLWHFTAFKSKIVKLYAGPGIAVGFGESGGWFYKEKKGHFWYRSNDETGFGARAVFGLNIIPRNAPIEIFGELGVLIGFIPTSGVAVEGAIGIRFYP